jgi:Skp family chaperone for outer membrane proteins
MIMRGQLTTGGTIAVLLVTLAWSADPGAAVNESSQPPDAAAASFGIAVIDVGRVFRDHGRFQEQLKSLQGELQAAQQTLAVRQVEIENTQRKLQKLRPGTPQHEQTQLLLARLQTELKLYGQRLQQDFAQREAILYAELYGHISSAVEQYAQQHQIRLVLRSNEITIDPQNRNSVLGAVNRDVVYQQGLDITDAILQELNAEQAQ